MKKRVKYMKLVYSSTIHPSLRELLSYATSESAIEREYEKYLMENSRHLYSWEVNGEAIGCMGIEFINAAHCVIKHIAVSPAARGNGVGRKMIDFICDEYSFDLISVETDKDAVEFYRSYGFKITSLGEKYPGVERFLCELKPF